MEVRHLFRNVQKQNRHQHWVHVLALQGQAVPSPSGQGAHHFSRLLHLAVGGVGLGVGWGSGPLGAATRCPRRRRPFHFFFATWPFLAIRNVRVLGFTTTTDETGLPPLNPLLLRTENCQIFIANFFQKKIGAKFFLAIFIKNDLTKSAPLFFAVFLPLFGYGTVISVLVRSMTLP